VDGAKVVPRPAKPARQTEGSAPSGRRAADHPSSPV